MQHKLLTAFLTALLALPLHAKPATPAVKPKTAGTTAPAQLNAANLMGKTILDIDIRGIDNIQQYDNAKTYLTL